jgi:hypothetical protein
MAHTKGEKVELWSFAMAFAVSIQAMAKAKGEVIKESVWLTLFAMFIEIPFVPALQNLHFGMAAFFALWACGIAFAVVLATRGYSLGEKLACEKSRWFGRLGLVLAWVFTFCLGGHFPGIAGYFVEMFALFSLAFMAGAEGDKHVGTLA